MTERDIMPEPDEAPSKPIEYVGGPKDGEIHTAGISSKVLAGWGDGRAGWYLFDSRERKYIWQGEA